MTSRTAGKSGNNQATTASLPPLLDLSLPYHRLPANKREHREGVKFGTSARDWRVRVYLQGDVLTDAQTFAQLY